jgi:hypothetical protein
LLSRLHRKTEALDSACLRALGHPHDHAIRQELLSALEWDDSLHPEHARPAIRDLFSQVHAHSTELAKRLQAAAHADGGFHPVAHGIESLRHSLVALKQVLAARHREPPKD